MIGGKKLLCKNLHSPRQKMGILGEGGGLTVGCQRSGKRSKSGSELLILSLGSKSLDTKGAEK